MINSHRLLPGLFSYCSPQSSINCSPLLEPAQTGLKKIQYFQKKILSGFDCSHQGSQSVESWMLWRYRIICAYRRSSDTLSGPFSSSNNQDQIWCSQDQCLVYYSHYPVVWQTQDLIKDSPRRKILQRAVLATAKGGFVQSERKNWNNQAANIMS